MKSVTKSHPLVGQFFHSFRYGKVYWQGQVKAVVDPGFYLCQLFEWFMGGESCCEVITTRQMAEMKFRFYDNQEYWKSEGDRLSHNGEEAKDQKPGKDQVMN